MPRSSRYALLHSSSAIFIENMTLQRTWHYLQIRGHERSNQKKMLNLIMIMTDYAV